MCFTRVFTTWPGEPNPFTRALHSQKRSSMSFFKFYFHSAGAEGSLPYGSQPEPDNIH